ncbi:putative major facilitator superfamily protein [Rosellinia necatrix]|uniref:Putative major facilitator superfamily protein n=1 Tax=Rosellinia necatrix TaxID=77044 RepID=A0A1S8A9C6_ROSNE|nr:putative major facilitator superfamily protein [Rosellinia necatrix]
MAEDGAEEARMDTLNRQAYKLIFRDWKIWLASLTLQGVGITGYSLAFFMPTILVEFGWKARDAQVHSIPVYAAAAVAMILVAWLSDRYKHRYGFIILCCSVATIGYGLLLGQQHLPRPAKYGALFLAAMGGWSAVPVAVVWLSNNVSGHWKRAFAAGIQLSLGNTSGLVATNVFLDRESPRYVTGYAVALALTWLGAAAATVLVLALRAENRRRDAGARDYRLRRGRPAEEVRNLGDDHPSFRFTL